MPVPDPDVHPNTHLTGKKLESAALAAGMLRSVFGERRAECILNAAVNRELGKSSPRAILEMDPRSI